MSGPAKKWSGHWAGPLDLIGAAADWALSGRQCGMAPAALGDRTGQRIEIFWRQMARPCGAGLIEVDQQQLVLCESHNLC
jgi:hypothetical protein